MAPVEGGGDCLGGEGGQLSRAGHWDMASCRLMTESERRQRRGIIIAPVAYTAPVSTCMTELD